MREASGPRGRQVWLWNRKIRDVYEEWIKDEGQSGSSLQARNEQQNQQDKGQLLYTHFCGTTEASTVIVIINSSINNTVALALEIATLLVFVMTAAVITVMEPVSWRNCLSGLHKAIY